MKTEHFFQRMSDGIEVAVTRWIPDAVGRPRAIVQISHGMVEHVLRYEEYARALTEHGFMVSAHDHRGHGMTAEHAVELGTGQFGVFAERDGFTRVVDDLDEVILRAEHDYPGIAVILFGHSFGSFVAQSYIERYASHSAGCILCGSAGPRRLLTAAGRCVATVVCACRGRTHRSPFLQKLAFGSYCARIPDAVTGFEWLTRDLAYIKKYADDPWCGFLPSAGFFYDMLDGLCRIHARRAIRAIPHHLPVLLISGGEDPVGSYGQTVTALAALYKSIGMKDVTSTIYAGARHELLNETNRADIMRDTIQWLERVTRRADGNTAAGC